MEKFLLQPSSQCLKLKFLSMSSPLLKLFMTVDPLLCENSSVRKRSFVVTPDGEKQGLV